MKKRKQVSFVFDERLVSTERITNGIVVTVIDPGTGKHREITLPRLSQRERKCQQC